MKRDLISFSPFTRDEIGEIFSLTARMKKTPGFHDRPMTGKTAVLVFEKQSLRTHLSFEIGVAQLGGTAVYLDQRHIGLGTREPVRDVAEVIACYSDMIIARTMEHRTVEALACHATVPVINALTDLLHPCQILADAFTLWERDLFHPETTVAFIGDGNNVVNSWLELAEKTPFRFVLACPEGYEPDKQILNRARKAGVSEITITRDPLEAASGADALYTDVWVSMGQEEERAKRLEAFRGYQINQKLLAVARPGCVVMHCLPAHRGEEITADVLEGDRSVVIRQAENRLHVQKGVMAFLIAAGESLPRMSPSIAESVPA